MRYCFDDFAIDIEKFELRRGVEVRHVEPLVFDLLHYFAAHAGDVLSRDDIIEHVWKGRIVSDATVAGCVKAARKALGDSGQAQNYIRTVRGRGFQFASPVTFENDAPPQRQRPNDTRAPTLAILPIEVIGEEAALAAVARGLAGNLATILNRVPMLAVSTPREEAPRSGYLLEGSLQDLGDRVQANIQLLNAETGVHLWARPFEEEPGADVMTRLLHQILPRLEVQLVRAMLSDLRGERDTQSSRHLLIQAISTLSLKGWNAEAFAEARDLLRQSIALEEDFALSHAYLALVLGLGYRIGLFQRSEHHKQEAIAQAEGALTLDPNDSNVLGIAGCALADIGLPERAIPLLEQAIDINPLNPQAWAALGSAHLFAGDIQDSIRCGRYGIEISPMDSRRCIWGAVLAVAYLANKQLDDALAVAQASCTRDHKTYLPWVALAAIQALQRDTDAALAALEEAKRLKPDLDREQISHVVGRSAALALERVARRAAR